MARVVQIRDVPDAVHAELTSEAEAAGMSLNRFLLRELERISRRNRNADVLRRAAHRRGRRLTSADAVTVVREDRDRGR